MEMSVERRTELWLLLCAMLVLATGCSRGPSDPSSESSSAASTAMPTDPQRRSIDGQVLGTGDQPGYTVQAPSSWHTEGNFFVVKDVGGVLGIGVWDVKRVPRDPCHWKGNLSDPGPTVDDLVEALTGQRMRHATDPVDVSLGGYRGTFVEWSVPEDAVVTGDADFQGCDIEPSSGHRDFVSWFDSKTSDRYQQVAGQVDLLWILDVNGQRLVVDATYSPDITEADRDELREVVESIRFGT
jgi:hypothetical protein